MVSTFDTNYYVGSLHQFYQTNLSTEVKKGLFQKISEKMDAYIKLFTNNPTKVILLALSCFLLIIITPLLYSIISFERDNHHRTLINQLMASTVWSAVLWNFTVQQLDLYRSVFGPLPEYICRINSLLRNALPMHGLLLMDATMVVKYVFMFHMKNPTAVQDDFWNRFLNMSVGLFTLISQVIHIMSPGPNAPNFFVCIGTFPDDFSNLCTAKKNYTMTFVLVVSVLSYSFVGIRYVHYKYWNLRKGHVAEPKKTFTLTLNRNTIVSFTTNGIILVMLSLSFLVMTKLNKVNLEALNEQPNDAWYYVMHHILPCLCETVVVFVYFGKTKELRHHVWIEMFQIVSMFYSTSGKKTGKIFPII